MLSRRAARRMLAILEQTEVGRFDDMPAYRGFRGIGSQPAQAKQARQNAANEKPLAMLVMEA